MKLVLQPRSSISHHLHKLILKVKVGAGRATAKFPYYDEIRDILRDKVELTARTQFVGVPPDVVDLAVAMMIDEYRECTLFMDSVSLEVTRIRRALGVWNRQDDQADDSWPDWLVLLFAFVEHSRRSWTYQWLAGARDSSRGWLGKLAAIYGIGQPALAIDRGQFENVVQELMIAYSCWASGHASQSDPIHDLFQRLNAVPVNPSMKAYANALQACMLAPPIAASPAYPALSEALADAQNRLKTVSPRSILVDSLVQLRTETSQPGSTTLPGSPIESVLNSIAPDHKGENSPAAVLSAISSIPVVSGPSSLLAIATGLFDRPDDSATVRQRLSLLLLEDALADGAADQDWHVLLYDVYLSLINCHDWEEIQARLANRLPTPDRLTRLCEELQRVLTWWEGLLGGGGKGALAAWNLWEVPRNFWSNAAGLSSAVAVLEVWKRTPPPP